MVLEQLDINMQKNEVGLPLHVVCKKQLQIDQRPKCKTLINWRKTQVSIFPILD